MSEAMVESIDVDCSFDSVGDLDTTNTESDAHDDSDTSEDSTRTQASTPPLAPPRAPHHEELQNNTEKAITTFERFVSREWPENCNDVAIKKLGLQLKYGGGFISTMKTIDFSTPKDVRLDTDKVWALLYEKTRHSRIESVEKLVLPVVTKLRSGEVVRDLIKDFCLALAGGSNQLPLIDEIVLHCDEIPDNFCTGDLDWIERFYSICKPVTQDKPNTTIKVSSCVARNLKRRAKEETL